MDRRNNRRMPVSGNFTNRAMAKHGEKATAQNNAIPVNNSGIHRLSAPDSPEQDPHGGGHIPNGRLFINQHSILLQQQGVRNELKERHFRNHLLHKRQPTFFHQTQDKQHNQNKRPVP